MFTFTKVRSNCSRLHRILGHQYEQFVGCEETGRIMPCYKLKYFDARCKAELARLMFAYQKQDYEDYRFAMSSWREEKPKTPFGQVPTLEIDGKVYSESVAINNHLARQFGLYGKTDEQKLEIDQVGGIVQDIWKYIIDWIHENEETGKEKQRKINEEVIFPKYLTALEKILNTNGTGFYVGDQISYADISVFDALDIEVPESLLENYPLVKANRDMVKNHERLKDYIANRKDAEL